MFEKVFVQYVHLADTEYGNDLMYRVAEEILRKPENVARNTKETAFVVHVFEHGGWSLSFTLINNEVTTVDSANDAAVYTGDKLTFRQKAKNAKWENVQPEIWRGRKEGE